MNLSAPFIRRPVGTSLLALGLFLCGLVAYRFMPVAPVPKVDYPMITVYASLPGADPETVASSLATPLERRLGQISGISEMTSTSSLGSCSVRIQFDLSRDINSAAQDVQAAINASMSELPPGMPRLPSYRKVNPADMPILILALTSDKVPLANVFEYADQVLAQKISQVEGVSEATISGAEKAAVRVRVNPGALASAGMGVDDIRTMLAQTNVNLPVGSIEGSSVVHTVVVNGQVAAARPYNDLVIPRKGGTVELRNFGTAFESVENTRTAGWAGGKRAVLVFVNKEADANVIETVDRVKAALPQLASWMPPGVDMTILSDRTVTIRASVRDVQFSLLVSISLVVMVVFLFLRRFWPTFIANITVPLSLAGTMAGMYLCGFTLDNLSLMAITISVGFVVDDAIVVIENVHRLVEEGHRPTEAALAGSRQIGFTVASMSLSLIAVFIPLLFMGGLVGRLFREFAVTVSLAILVSGVLSLTLTPMLCSRFLRAEADLPPHGPVGRFLGKAFDAMLADYDRGLCFVLRHKRMTLVFTALTMVFTVFLYTKVPTGLFPQQDTGSLSGTTEAAQDVSFEEMSRLQQKVMAIVLADPAVQNVGGFISGGSNNGRLFIILKPVSERRESADVVMDRLRRKTAHIPGINLFMQSVQDIRVGGRPTKAQYQYAIQAATPEELDKWSKLLVDRLSTSSIIRDANTDLQARGLQMNVVIDREAASRYGVSVSSIDNALYDAFGQRQVSNIYTSYNQHRVVLEADAGLLRDPASLDKVFVRSGAGKMVPLASVAHFEYSNTSLSVNHQGQFPAVTVSFNVAPGASLGDAMKEVNRVMDSLHPPSSVRGSFQGTSQQFQSSAGSLPLLILGALLAVYIVLGILYESLIHPLTILSTLPSAGLGALLAVLVSGFELSIVAFIGIILLMGIVKKNAIMMVDFAIDAERGLGLSPEEAIHRACLLRFRPIMMTTMAALLGAVPLAIGMGEGSELRQPLGVAVLGGLVISQLLTLFTTPVVYLAMDRLRRGMSRLFQRIHSPSKSLSGGRAAEVRI